MDSTSYSLLRRLQSDEKEIAWERFVEIYAPLIFHWGRKQGLHATDAAELVQEVLAIVVVKLPEFKHDPTRHFRGWLRTVAINKATDLHRRNSARPDQANHEAVTVESNVDLLEETEYRQFLVTRALQVMQVDFHEASWKACWMQIIEGKSAGDVADELGITVNAVRVAKCRVLRRLREELKGLLE